MNETVMTPERLAALKEAFRWHALLLSEKDARARRDECLKRAGLAGLLD